MSQTTQQIMNFVNDSYGFSFSTKRYSLFDDKISTRLAELGIYEAGDYIHLLKSDPDELTRLINLITVNISRFFRNALTFELISGVILPGLIEKKMVLGKSDIRIWSAGCANGEEVYSVAILLKMLLEKRQLEGTDLFLFATDINQEALANARKGRFEPQQLANVKFKILKKYFKPENGGYRLDKRIVDMVNFSPYNIMDQNTDAPPESIFGTFDLVLCRNLLIYFNRESQNRIFKKLYRSLTSSGCLVLGKAETIPDRYKKRMQILTAHSQIYMKT